LDNPSVHESSIGGSWTVDTGSLSSVVSASIALGSGSSTFSSEVDGLARGVDGLARGVDGLARGVGGERGVLGTVGELLCESAGHCVSVATVSAGWGTKPL